MARVNDQNADIIVFSGGRTTPLVAKYVIDVSTVRDPTGQKAFHRFGDGRHPDVQKWMAPDPKVKAIIREAGILAAQHITAMKDSFLGIGVQDHHGRWAAPAMAEMIADYLADAGYRVSVLHRGLGQAMKK